MDEGTKIFNEGNSDKWLIYSISTDEDQERHIAWGSYWYDAEDGDDTSWRLVTESVTMPLKRFLELRETCCPVDNSPEEYNRRCDYICDLTEEEAREDFSNTYNTLPKLDWEYISCSIRDGTYIGRYEGMRRKEE